MRGPRHRTSLPLAVVLYFGQWYSVLFWILSILVFFYKGYNLLFPDERFGIEIACLLIYLLVEPARISMMDRGNKASSWVSMLGGLLLSVILIVYYSYLMFLQTYVLKIDLVLGGAGLGFTALQLVFGCFVLAVS
ncbi:unnamed protein product [Pedinophyceae sp. YPF-701]|nr:unnamed protein product [Pedinophyceae sp. YPF-701]